MMKNKKQLQAFVIGMSLFTLAGCGVPNDTDTDRTQEAGNTYMENPMADPDQKEPSAGNNGNADVGAGGGAAGEVSGGEIIAASDLQGSVIEFSDTGCRINPVTSSEDGSGSTASIAAEGHEEEDAKVTVTYEEGCIFQRAVINITTGKADVREASVSDIKKKTSLLLYGNFEDTEHFTAAKAVIVRYE